jgi:phosphatidylglycerol---prolipoprotein diacylglyceryl transferase
LSPLIPYLELPELPIVSARFFGNFPKTDITFKPFGLLLALGAYLATVASLRQARRLGASDRAVLALTGWVAVFALVFAHWIDALFYFPEDVRADPMFLLRFWEGLSSFGGFVGAFVGAFAWRAYYKAALLPHADIVASSYPLAMALGRLGCAFAHDHPGVRSDFFLAVRYPDGGRHDLGFYEFLLLTGFAVAFLLLRHKPRPWGFYGGILCAGYAPVRFGFDFLRERADAVGLGGFATGDARYLGLTPAQWLCVPLFAVGVTLLARMKKEGTALPVVPPVFATSRVESSGVDAESSGSDASDER